MASLNWASSAIADCEPDCDFSTANSDLGLSSLHTVYRIGEPAGPALILLHELPGLSPSTLATARRFSQHGFSVYVPLMFGSFRQYSVARGYVQSCLRGEFVCGRKATRSPIQDWLQEVCKAVHDRANAPVGVIGMCLTGIFPLALLGAGAQAAVVCQPTIPFTALLGKPIGEEKSDLGLSDGDLAQALLSTVPILAMRFGSDPKCPPERFLTLQAKFRERVAIIDLSHHGHSTLAGDFSADAFADTLQYLKIQLRLEPGPKRMSVARLGGQPCEISAERTWRAISVADETGPAAHR